MSKGLILTHLQDEMGSHILPSHVSDNVGALVNLNKKGTKDVVDLPFKAQKVEKLNIYLCVGGHL